uniref:Disease resistance protein winged helix domain-containing protein n=1 Tax=Chenopodium quinoa TaxID=63459 RepID=A0A803LZV7_CHEQI
MASLGSRTFLIEYKSLTEKEILEPKPKARKIVRQKLEAILTKKLGFTEEAKSNQMKREEGMWLVCTLFPETYEFNKETLVQLWMARGFLNNNNDDYKKQIGDTCFGGRGMH